MHVTCDRELFASVLGHISKITKKEVFPLFRAVLLIATVGQERGTLTVIGMGSLGMVGLYTQLQAIVDEEGDVLVPIEPLASYVETLRTRSLTLMQERPPSSLRVEPGQDQATLTLTAPERAAPFLIESTETSDAGTTSTHKARLNAWSSVHYPVPPVQEWERTPLDLCTLSTPLLKKALAVCAPLARSGARSKGSAAEMDGIHLCLEAHSLTLSATTGTLLVSYRLPLVEPIPFVLAGLFKGDALFWIKEALPKKGKLRLALTRDAQTQKLVLLLSTAHATWFCHSMEVPSSIHWEDLFQLPHQAEILIRQDELRRPLKLFAKLADALEGVVLTTDGLLMRISTVIGSDDPIYANQTLRLESTSTNITALVNPRQFQRLAQLASSGKLLRLEIGHVDRHTQKGKEVIGFMRASSEYIQVMMSLNREEKRIMLSSSFDQLQESASVPVHIES